jgi:hypothetical protein
MCSTPIPTATSVANPLVWSVVTAILAFFVAYGSFYAQQELTAESAGVRKSVWIASNLRSFARRSASARDGEIIDRYTIHRCPEVRERAPDEHRVGATRSYPETDVASGSRKSVRRHCVATNDQLFNARGVEC